MIYSYFPPKMWTCPKTRKPNHFLMGGEWETTCNNELETAWQTRGTYANTHRTFAATLINQAHTHYTRDKYLNRMWKWLKFSYFQEASNSSFSRSHVKNCVSCIEQAPFPSTSSASVLFSHCLKASSLITSSSYSTSKMLAMTPV